MQDHTLLDRIHVALSGEPFSPSERWALDVAAVGSTVYAIMGWFPAIAAALACVWYVLLIIDWFEKRKKAHREAAKQNPPSP